MMELRIQLIPTGEIILPPGKNGENYCHNCKVSSHTAARSEVSSGVRFFHSSFVPKDLIQLSGKKLMLTQLRLKGSSPTRIRLRNIYIF